MAGMILKYPGDCAVVRYYDSSAELNIVIEIGTTINSTALSPAGLERAWIAGFERRVAWSADEARNARHDLRISLKGRYSSSCRIDKRRRKVYQLAI
jgi:hypothetical protein